MPPTTSTTTTRQAAHVHHHGHGHGHQRIDPDAPDHLRRRQQRVLWFSLGINGLLLVAEVIGGIVFGSLALLADAAHMLSDVAGLAIALVAQSLMVRPHSPRHTYGLMRAEALGAQANAVLLLVSTGWIVYEAVQRISDPHPVQGGAVLVVAVLGLLVNVGSMWALARVRGDNLNIEGAHAHMMADALGSVGAIVAGLAVVTVGWVWVDTAASVLIAGLVLVSGARLLSATTHVLMEGAPSHLDVGEVSAAIRSTAGVEDVHHVHLWSLSTDTPALSAHVVMEGAVDLHGAQEKTVAIRERLHGEFGIDHSTLELECHACE